LSTKARTGLARVTVVAPHTRVDLALPHGSTLAELLPTLLRITGEDLAGEVGSEAWVLSRLGEPPLDSSRTVDSHAVRDGEVLYLHPRADQPPAPVFDDVVDAVATAAGDPVRGWQPETTRHVGLLAAGVLLTAAALVPVLAGGSRALAVTLATGTSVVLLAVALVLSRAVGDSFAALAPSLGAVAHAAAAGFVSVHSGPVLDAGRGALAGAGAAAALAAVVAAVVVGDFVPLYAALAVTAAVAGLAALVALLVDARTAAAAAVSVALVFALLPTLPILALRLGRLPLPAMPTDAADLQRDDVLAGTDTLRRAEAADRFLTAVVVAAAIVATGAGVLVALADSATAGWLAASVAAALLLRGRLHGSAAQRAALLVAGGTVAGVLLCALATRADPGDRLLVAFAVLLAAGALVLAAGLVVPARHHSPYWGRFADVVEVVSPRCHPAARPRRGRRLRYVRGLRRLTRPLRVRRHRAPSRDPRICLSNGVGRTSTATGCSPRATSSTHPGSSRLTRRAVTLGAPRALATRAAWSGSSGRARRGRQRPAAARCPGDRGHARP
jgi:type VII secretion integral membrane protein EccD